MRPIGGLRPAHAAVLIAVAIAAGGGLAFWYKSAMRASEAPPVAGAVLMAVRDHIEAIGVPLWPGADVGLRDGRERLDGAIVVVGDISAPAVGNIKRRTLLEAMLRRTCSDVDPKCFRVIGLRLDGVAMPLVKPILGGGL